VDNAICDKIWIGFKESLNKIEMKNLKMFLFLAILSAGALSIASCGGSGENNSEATEHEHADDRGKEYTSAYVCEMHCEGSGSDKPGECPKCGMKYVANTDKADDHGDHDQ